ncbi:MAG TPA: hypothetical protein VFH78_12015 [Candidatus Thermoplasmatota archaeon]|nr:hypothetical protein [Candidatus Thermoplasmatota archaeon]
MPGRKNPEPTEQEREREYMLAQKRGYGESVVGDEGKELEGKGAVGKVEQRREKWAEEQERVSQQDF